jgi:hypothetical protein
MNATAMTDKERKRGSLRLWLWVAAVLALVLAANAHLIYVATASQPPCVAHVRQGEGSPAHGQFSAAQSSCSVTRRGDPS